MQYPIHEPSYVYTAEEADMSRFFHCLPWSKALSGLDTISNYVMKPQLDV